MAYLRENKLKQVICFRSTLRPHNCPHCDCNNSLASQQIIRYVNSGEKKIISNQNIGIYTTNRAHQLISPIKNNYLQYSPRNKQMNIYYQRNDLSISRKQGINKSRAQNILNTSQSRHNYVQRIIISPPKAHQTRVNIQYSSPEKPKMQNIRFKTMNYDKQQQNASKPSIYFRRTNNQMSSQNILAQNLIKNEVIFNSDESNTPRVPSILKRKKSIDSKIISQQKLSKHLKNQKSSQNLNEKTNNSNNKPQVFQNQTQKKQCHNVIAPNEKNLVSLSAIMSRKSIKSSSLPVSNYNKQFQKQQIKQPSAYDVLLQCQQQRIIATQISKDLKLHYDYFETRDISKLSANIY